MQSIHILIKIGGKSQGMFLETTAILKTLHKTELWKM